MASDGINGRKHTRELMAAFAPVAQLRSFGSAAGKQQDLETGQTTTAAAAVLLVLYPQ